MNFLNDIGWYGVDSNIEECLLSLLINGDAGLLFGGRGANKTNGLKGLASLVLDGDDFNSYFHAYSLPNDEFEDMLGIPNPSALARGEMDYIQSDISIWKKKFVLLDEVNRANPMMQSKYLQLLLSRAVLGRQTDVIWCFGAMNPLHYSGTNPLDPAFADRFSLMLDIPEFFELDSNDQVKAVGNHGSDSFYALKHWNNNTRVSLIQNASYSDAKVKNARDRFKQLVKEVTGDPNDSNDSGMIGFVDSLYGDSIRTYVSRIVTMMCKSITDNSKLSHEDKNTAKELLSSGRRSSMIYRSIVTRLAIRNILEGNMISKESINSLVRDTYHKSLTVKATGMDFDVPSFEICHPTAVSIITSVGNPWDYKIETESNMAKKLAMVLNFKIKPGTGSNPDVEGILEQLLVQPDTSFTPDDANIPDFSKGFKDSNLVPNVKPLLLSMYLNPILDVSSELVSPELKARLASFMSHYSIILDRHIYASPDETTPLVGGIEKTFNDMISKLNSKYTETNNPVYVYLRDILSTNISIIFEALEKGLTKSGLPVWINTFNEVTDELLTFISDCEKYIDPIVSNLLHMSGIDPSKIKMSKTEAQEKSSALMNEFRK